MAVELKDLEDRTIAETGKLVQQMLRGDKFLVSELVDVILKKAAISHASDIHVEPGAKGVRIRYRVDGVFQDLVLLPKDLHDQVLSRIKVLADLISHKREVTQEGRISIAMPGRSQEFRVSIIPTVAGEKAVIRMFSPSEASFDIDKLGYAPEVSKRLAQLLARLRGMLVLCGPAGSGKTTTLYSSLLKLHREMDQYVSIVTIEDPVEFEFGVFAQMQVNRLKGLDFAQGLKSVLRQDPEVIMVGEIRDTETCEVALRAGLTGHLVLTTIHAGSAVEVITRLLNMGIEPFIVASAITGVLAQRLLRVNCADCTQPYTPEKIYLDYMERIAGRSDVEFKKGRGCAQCQYTGFRGRIPVAELLVFDDSLRGMVLEKPSTTTMKQFVVSRGMHTILEDGIDKVAKGLTTIDEVFRVASLEDAGP